MTAIPLSPIVPASPPVAAHTATGHAHAGNHTSQAAHTVARALRSRSIRVCILLVAVVLMSIADLYMTLTYLQGPGMGEGNPIARWIMSANCPWALGSFKLGLLAISCFILLKVRHRKSAELGTWLCLVVMVWLTMQWKEYNEAMPGLAPIIHRMATAHTGEWVRFTDE